MELDIVTEDNQLNEIIHKNFCKGMVLKNYKELCELLNLDILNGKSKIYQINNLQRFCEFGRDGQKYIILKIYKIPKEKEDKRGTTGNNKVYVTLIESILLGYFIRINKDKVTLSKKELWKELGMINDNYSFVYEKDAFLSAMQEEDKRIQQWHIDQAYLNSRNKLNDITKSALRSLQNRKLISYKDIIFSCTNGKSHEVKHDNDIIQILKCERKALDELECENIQDIIYHRVDGVDMKKYLDVRNEILHEQLGIDFIFKKYEILCNRTYLQREMQKNINELRKQLNGKLIYFLEKQAQKDYFKNREEVEFGETFFEYPEYYVEIQKLIFDKILKIDEDSAKNFIKSIQIDYNLDEYEFPV